MLVNVTNVHFNLFQPKPGRLHIPVLLRTVFIPLFLFCNYETLNSERIMPIYIKNDYAYFAIAVAFALSGGYYSSVSMMYCSK